MNLPPGYVEVRPGEYVKGHVDSVTVGVDRVLNVLNLEHRPADEESRLNKLEKDRLAYLRSQSKPSLRIQAITLKLAFDTRLTMDFSYIGEDSRIWFEDVKGFQREDALIKARMAARLFPEFRFWIVKRVNGAWEMEEAKP